MKFLIFCTLFVVASGEYYGYNTAGLVTSDDLTLTVTTVFNYFSTITQTVFNSVPVVVTKFSKFTTDLPSLQVIRTPVDDIVKVSTVRVTKPTTETVTDVVTSFKFSTEIATDINTITHFDYDVLRTTVTSVVVQTETVFTTFTRTLISTETNVFTETKFLTKTLYADHSRRNPYIY